ncbi:MAG TPA: response regulator [Thermoanaerobaculia bacterium]|nr:response regulator [Thermoanaerobaculia bacterium]
MIPAKAPVIHVVDDDDSFRTALSRLLKAAGYATQQHRSAGEFLLDPPGAPGCVLLDVHMPGPSGLDLQEAIAKRGDGLPVIFLTGHGDVRQSVRAMRGGAVNFLTKPVERQELLAAIEEALARQRAQAADAGRRREAARRYARLTAREREVFALVVSGKINKQIGAALGVSERTVKAHRAQVMEKMEVGSVAELVQADGLMRERSHPGRPAEGPTE